MASYTPAFAWLPTRMSNGKWVFMITYQAVNGGKIKRLYENAKGVSQ